MMAHEHRAIALPLLVCVLGFGLKTLAAAPVVASNQPPCVWYCISSGYGSAQVTSCAACEALARADCPDQPPIVSC